MNEKAADVTQPVAQDHFNFTLKITRKSGSLEEK